MDFFVEVIRERDFVVLANKAIKNMLNFSVYLSKNKQVRLSRRLYVNLVKESNELEDFLDDHGARKNKTWVFFGEIIASIRNFAGTAYIISHILSRIKFYRLDSKKITSFVKDAEGPLQFLDESLLSLFANLRQEALTLGLSIPSGRVKDLDYSENIYVKMLPQDIYDEGTSDLHQSIIRIATEFIDGIRKSSAVLFEKKMPAARLNSRLIPERINEETLRHLETHVHNAQSMYDTYIQKTPEETSDPMLAGLRGHISVTLHLLGIAKELSHFIERHETSVRREATREKIAKIINRKKVLEVIINFALHHYTRFLHDGEDLANRIIAQYTVVDSVVVSIPQGLGFHLRPSTLVVKIANHYGSHLKMLVNEKEFDATSVIDIMWAGGMIKKESIDHVEFRGERNAIRDIELLAHANYGEDTMGSSTPLPDELAYLRRD